MTNPDNVGGLQRYAAVFVDDDPKKELLFIAKSKTGNLVMYDDAIAYGELCRAAPAGGDDFLAKLEARIAREKNKTRRWALICFRDSIVAGVEPDSAPAGSGEVEALASRLVSMSNGLHSAHLCTDLRRAAALLRKLQQGADYVVVPRIRFEALEASNAEYNAWLDEYHGGGDFTDFLHRYIASQQKEGSS